MKSFVLSATYSGSPLAGNVLKADGTGGVTINDGAATGLGIAEATPFSGATKIGVIKQGLVKVQVANATYKFGDALITGAGGQIFEAGAGKATAAESKTTTALDPYLWAYVNYE